MIMLIKYSHNFVIDYMQASAAVFVLCAAPSFFVSLVVARFEVERVRPDLNVHFSLLRLYYAHCNETTN